MRPSLCRLSYTASRTSVANARSRLLAVLCVILFGSVPASGQAIDFEIQSLPGSPIAVVNERASLFRMGDERRQFLTFRNDSDKTIDGFLVEQSFETSAARRIVTLEYISVIMRPKERKRLSFSVADVWYLLKSGAGVAGHPPPTPILRIVGAEFLDGGYWRPERAPAKPAQAAR
jgi:hypothetical protein